MARPDHPHQSVVGGVDELQAKLLEEESDGQRGPTGGVVSVFGLPIRHDLSSLMEFRFNFMGIAAYMYARVYFRFRAPNSLRRSIFGLIRANFAANSANFLHKDKRQKQPNLWPNAAKILTKLCKLFV